MAVLSVLRGRGYAYSSRDLLYQGRDLTLSKTNEKVEEMVSGRVQDREQLWNKMKE